MAFLRCILLAAMVFTIVSSNESKKIMCLTENFMDDEHKIEALASGCDFLTTQRIVLDAHSKRTLDITETSFQLENDKMLEAKTKSKKKFFKYGSKSKTVGFLAHIHVVDVGKYFNEDMVKNDFMAPIMKEIMADPYKGALVTAGSNAPMSVLKTIIEELAKIKHNYPERKFMIFLGLRDHQDWMDLSDLDNVIAYYLLPSAISLSTDKMAYEITGKSNLKITDLKPWRQGGFPMKKALGQLSLNYYEVVSVGKNKHIMEIHSHDYLLKLMDKKRILWSCYNKNGQLIGFNKKAERAVMFDTFASLSHWFDKYMKNEMGGFIYQWKGDKWNLSDSKKPPLLSYLQNRIEDKPVTEFTDKEKLFHEKAYNVGGNSGSIPRCEDTTNTKESILNILMDTKGGKKE